MFRRLGFAVVALLAACGRFSDAEVCVWCDKGLTMNFMNCLYYQLTISPIFNDIPRETLEDMESSILAASYAMTRTQDFMKIKIMSGALAGELTGMILGSGDPLQASVDEALTLSGNCYAASTGSSGSAFVAELGKSVQNMIADIAPATSVAAAGAAAAVSNFNQPPAVAGEQSFQPDPVSFLAPQQDTPLSNPFALSPDIAQPPVIGNGYSEPSIGNVPQFPPGADFPNQFAPNGNSFPFAQNANPDNSQQFSPIAAPQDINGPNINFNQPPSQNYPLYQQPDQFFSPQQPAFFTDPAPQQPALLTDPVPQQQPLQIDNPLANYYPGQFINNPQPSYQPDYGNYPVQNGYFNSDPTPGASGGQPFVNAASASAASAASGSSPSAGFPVNPNGDPIVGGQPPSVLYPATSSAAAAAASGSGGQPNANAAAAAASAASGSSPSTGFPVNPNGDPIILGQPPSVLYPAASSAAAAAASSSGGQPFANAAAAAAAASAASGSSPSTGFPVNPNGDPIVGGQPPSVLSPVASSAAAASVSGGQPIANAAAAAASAASGSSPSTGFPVNPNGDPIVGGQPPSVLSPVASSAAAASGSGGQPISNAAAAAASAASGSSPSTGFPVNPNGDPTVGGQPPSVISPVGGQSNVGPQYTIIIATPDGGQPIANPVATAAASAAAGSSPNTGLPVNPNGDPVVGGQPPSAPGSILPTNIGIQPPLNAGIPSGNPQIPIGAVPGGSPVLNAATNNAPFPFYNWLRNLAGNNGAPATPINDPNGSPGVAPAGPFIPQIPNNAASVNQPGISPSQILNAPNNAGGVNPLGLFGPPNPNPNPINAGGIFPPGPFGFPPVPIPDPNNAFAVAQAGPGFPPLPGVALNLPLSTDPPTTTVPPTTQADTTPAPTTTPAPPTTTPAPSTSTPQPTTDSPKACAMKFAETLFVNLLQDDRFACAFGTDTPHDVAVAAASSAVGQGLAGAGLPALSDEASTYAADQIGALPPGASTQAYGEKISKSALAPLYKYQVLQGNCEGIATAIAGSILNALPAISDNLAPAIANPGPYPGNTAAAAASAVAIAPPNQPISIANAVAVPDPQNSQPNPTIAILLPSNGNQVPQSIQAPNIATAVAQAQSFPGPQAPNLLANQPPGPQAPNLLPNQPPGPQAPNLLGNQSPGPQVPNLLANQLPINDPLNIGQAPTKRPIKRIRIPYKPLPGAATATAVAAAQSNTGPQAFNQPPKQFQRVGPNGRPVFVRRKNALFPAFFNGINAPQDPTAPQNVPAPVTQINSGQVPPQNLPINIAVISGPGFGPQSQVPTVTNTALPGAPPAQATPNFAAATAIALSGPQSPSGVGPNTGLSGAPLGLTPLQDPNTPNFAAAAASAVSGPGAPSPVGPNTGLSGAPSPVGPNTGLSGAPLGLTPLQDPNAPNFAAAAASAVAGPGAPSPVGPNTGLSGAPSPVGPNTGLSGAPSLVGPNTGLSGAPLGLTPLQDPNAPNFAAAAASAVAGSGAPSPVGPNTGLIGAPSPVGPNTGLSGAPLGLTPLQDPNAPNFAAAAASAVAGPGAPAGPTAQAQNPNAPNFAVASASAGSLPPSQAANKPNRFQSLFPFLFPTPPPNSTPDASSTSSDDAQTDTDAPTTTVAPTTDATDSTTLEPTSDVPDIGLLDLNGLTPGNPSVAVATAIVQNNPLLDGTPIDPSSPEIQNLLQVLMQAGLDSVSPPGFNYDYFVSVMTAVGLAIADNNPNATLDDALTQTYLLTIIALSQDLENVATAGGSPAVPVASVPANVAPVASQQINSFVPAQTAFASTSGLGNGQIPAYQASVPQVQNVQLPSAFNNAVPQSLLGQNNGGYSVLANGNGLAANTQPQQFGLPLNGGGQSSGLLQNAGNNFNLNTANANAFYGNLINK